MAFVSLNGLTIKKSALAGAIVSLGLGVFTNQASAGFPTWYGKLNVSLNQYDLEKSNFAVAGTGFATTGATSTTEELSNWALESNGSRLGVTGDFGLNYGLKAIYRLEYGTKVDNGSSGGQTFTQRNIWAGIESDDFGRIIAGKNDTPLKTLQTNSVLKTDIDRFNDLPLADLGTYLVGENRPDNVVQYSSPIWAGGLEVSLALVQGEETGVYESAAVPQDDDGIGSGYSASIAYGKSSWYLGLAYDSNVATTDTLRLVGEVDIAGVKIGALYQTAERHEDIDRLGGYANFVGASISQKPGVAPGGLNPLLDWDAASGTTPAYQEQTGYLVNVLWKVAGPWSVKAQYGASSSTPLPTATATYDDVDLTDLAFGVDFKLSDTAKLYSYYATIEAEGDSRINTESTTDSTFGLGLDLRF